VIGDVPWQVTSRGVLSGDGGIVND